MAGGAGTRLWPVSRKNKPKQLLKLIGDKTLLENTYDRCLEWVPADHIFIATTTDYADSIEAQLPNIPRNHYSIEPCLRGRGPAIGLAALIMQHHDPEAIFMCMWSDHSIKSEGHYFTNLLTDLEKFLSDHPESTITVGIKPQHAHTGLGYIEKGQKLENQYGLPLHKLKSFKEKPDIETANRFVAEGNYLWNSGYFAWKASTLLNLYKTHLPEIYNILMELKPYIGTTEQQSKINELYPRMPEVDIESGLLEKIQDNVLTLEGQFAWHDIGSWRVIKEVQSEGQENLTKGLVLSHDTENSLLYNYTDRVILATVGVKDLVIVVTPEAVLVADKNKTEEVKKIITQLEEKAELSKYL